MKESLEAIRILNTTEVAKIFRVPPATLTRWLNAEHPPELPIIRIGNNKRFVLEDVLKFIESRKNPEAKEGEPHGSYEPGKMCDMLINPGSVAKILGPGKDFTAEQIKLEKLRIADVLNGVSHIGISDLRIPGRIIGGLRGAKV
jgi:hypothetical protein